MNNAKDKIRSLFGAARPSPMHPAAPDDLAEVKLANLSLHTKHTQHGDHAALLGFHAIPGGLEFSVDYICTDANEKKRREHSSTHGSFKLLSL